mgnify:CR=1 FL=1|jgi:hypothetical protein
MNSSLSTLSDVLQTMLSEILDTLDLLHTVSIEFTVKREGNCIVGLETNFLCLLAEPEVLKRQEEIKNIIKNLTKL